MADIGRIRAELLLDSRGFEAGVQRARSEMAYMNSAARKTKVSLGMIETAALGIGTAVAAGIGGSVAVAANFESAIARVAAVSGATGDDLAALEQTARDLGATTVFSATQAAEGEYARPL